MGVFDPQPEFRGTTGATRMATAMDRPFSFGKAFTENFAQGALDSFGLGTAIRDMTTPSRVWPEPSDPNLPDEFEHLKQLNEVSLFEGIRNAFEGNDRKALTEDEYKSSPYYRETVPFQAGMTADRAAALASFADTRALRQHFSQKQPIGAFLGGFGGQMLDPINYVPMFGQVAHAAAVARFGSIAGRALIGASDATINTAVFGVLTSNVRQNLGDDVSFQMIASEVAMSALIGGVFGGGIGLAMRDRDAAQRVAEGRVRERMQTASNAQKATISINEAIDTLATTGAVDLSPNGMAGPIEVHTEIERRMTGNRALEAQTAQVSGTRAGEVAISPTGRRVAVRPEVVELDSLIHAQGALQVRNRTTAASSAQVEDIAINLDGARLMPNIDASQGAPLVGDDNIIDSGNGRVMGLRRAYEAYPEKAEEYRQFLADQGFNIEGMQRPVLISRRTTPLDEAARAQFNAEVNGPTTARMTAVEIAQMDRAAMTDNVLDAHADAPVTAASNRAFVNRFLNELPQNDRSGLLDEGGKNLNADGVRRVENALMAAAYGDVDPATVRRFAEGVDDNTRSIVGAMADVAGSWAKMRREAKAGNIPPHLDQTRELVTALRAVAAWREQAAREGRPVGKVISEGMAQMDLLSGEMSPEAQVFVRSFYKSDAFTQAVSRDALAKQFADLIESAYELGRPSLFGDALPEVKALEVLENAVRRNAEANPRSAVDAVSRAEENGTEVPQPETGANREVDRRGLEEGSEALVEADIFSHGADLATRKIGPADIATTMRQRFKSAGRPDDEAEAAATLLSNFYSTMAARTGRSVDDLVKIAPLPEAREGDSPATRAMLQYGLDIFRDVQGQRVRFDDEVQAQVYDLGVNLLKLNNFTLDQALLDDMADVVLKQFEPEVRRLLAEIGPYIDGDVRVDNPGEMARVAMDLAASVLDNGGVAKEAPTLIYADQQRAWTQRVFAGLRAEAEAALARGEQPRRAAEMQLTLFQSEPGSPAFDRWFGDSKVVDADGKPLVVYHGSPDARFLKEEDAQFKGLNERFGMPPRDDDGAFWFASDRSTAASYADDTRAWDYQNAEPGVQPFYVKLENPLVIDAAGKEWREAQARGKTSDVIEQARAEGRDGVIIRDVRDNYNNNTAKTRATDTFVAFDPTQIKSVNNRGTFDPNDPRILYQGADPRGSIEFDPSDGSSVISFFEGADASTALHESGHLFLQMFRSMAEKADAPAELKGDWDVVRAWWRENAEAIVADTPTGATVDDVLRALDTGTSGNRLTDIGIEVGMQEQWARAFETYLREGIAPSEGLRGIFEQFKRWLGSIYKRALDLNVNLTDDMRGVFDRMLAPERTRESLPPDATKAAPDPIPDGLDAAAARVGQAIDPMKLAEQYGLDQQHGFAEQADIEALRSQNLLSPEDQARLDAADQLYADSEAYAKTLETAAWCMR